MVVDCYCRRFAGKGIVGRPVSVAACRRDQAPDSFIRERRSQAPAHKSSVEVTCPSIAGRRGINRGCSGTRPVSKGHLAILLEPGAAGGAAGALTIVLAI